MSRARPIAFTNARIVDPASGLDARGALFVRDGRIEIAKADDAYNRAMEVGRAFSARYRRTMADLAK
jgi:predicted amidohydrolase